VDEPWRPLDDAPPSFPLPLSLSFGATISSPLDVLLCDACRACCLWLTMIPGLLAGLGLSGVTERRSPDELRRSKDPLLRSWTTCCLSRMFPDPFLSNLWCLVSPPAAPGAADLGSSLPVPWTCMCSTLLALILEAERGRRGLKHIYYSIFDENFIITFASPFPSYIFYANFRDKNLREFCKTKELALVHNTSRPQLRY
jgi:hypothetical protein